MFGASVEHRGGSPGRCYVVVREIEACENLAGRRVPYSSSKRFPSKMVLSILGAYPLANCCIPFSGPKEAFFAVGVMFYARAKSKKKRIEQQAGNRRQ